MQWIRNKGGTCMAVFLAFFVVTLFAGLTISGVSFKGCDFQDPQQDMDRTNRRVALETDLIKPDVVLAVNGRDVDEKLFSEKTYALWQQVRRGGSDDPATDLYIRGMAANYLVNEEVTIAKGEELNVKVTGEDVKEARDEIISQILNQDDGSTGNVLGDLAKQLGTNRERKAAFSQYLERQGMSEAVWEKNARRELFIQNTREAWQEAIDAQKAIEAGETKAIIDQRLADGDSFLELAIEYSEDNSVNKDPMPMGRGLVLPEQEEALFNTPVGELTDWIEIPAGWNRFEITEKKLAEGPEFEAEREAIVENLKGDNEDYEPTDDEIKRQYEKVWARQIILKTSEPGAVDGELEELVKTADVEYNDPYLLAYQALTDNKLQPPADMGYDKLVAIAQNAAVGEDYDFGLIQEALDEAARELGKPVAATEDTAVTEAEPAGADEAEAAGEDEAAESTAADEVEAADATAEADVAAADQPADEAAAAEAEREPVPIYALVIGLCKLAIQENDDVVGDFPYYIIGKVYMDWIDDEDEQERQPINRELARQEIEDNLSRAAERNEYSFMLHAYRGLNQAWLGQEEPALESLQKAIDLSPEESQLPTWDSIREAYEVLDRQDKIEELDAKLEQIRQVALQRMIEEAQQQNQASQPITIPMDEDESAGDEAAAEDAEAGDAEAAETAEPAAETDEPVAETDEPATEDEPVGEESAEPESADGE
ncbi:SurA N-terminal domain-containing protein [bacterium]|nr:SurA N-terminal domain-containing protein [bacterium]